ncbi:MAG: LysR family transcriptional regulator, partial [Rhodospirillales bacterium]|nr:LysR family transcriptional regulator [Rhodospirillales bacterium]
MSLSNVDLNLLKVLHALIEERSVTRAGERVGRTQPAMSNALNRLRVVFGDPLLVRGGGGLQLTPRAEELREPLSQILSSIEACLITETDFEPENISGVYRIAAPNFVSLQVLPPLIETISRSAPNMDIHVITEDRGLALDALDSNRVDIALGIFETDKSSIKIKPLFRQDFVGLMRKGHPLLKKKKFSLDDLMSYPHLLVSSGRARKGIFDDVLKGLNKERRIAVSVSHFLLAPYLLERSDMIGVFSRGVSETLRMVFSLEERNIPVAVANLEA